MLPSAHVLVEIAARTAVIYGVVLIGVRISGKREVGHMTKEHVSMDELQRAMREHGISSYHDVALAVLEVDGSISFLKYDEIQPTAQTHLARRKFIQKHE